VATISSESSQINTVHNTFDNARTGKRKVSSFLGVTHLPLLLIPPAVEMK